MFESETFLAVLELLNETLTATVVIVSGSILLYNLARQTQDQVAKTSAAVLACVTFTYLADILISLEPGDQYLEAWFRLQWIGIAFVPAALFHLSDALLATTGRPSRGRRKLVIRISYGISTVFSLLALFSDALMTRLDTTGIPRMRPGPAFSVYVAYLVVIGFVSTVNVMRARRRCLTRYTRRRMAYLLSVFLSPVYGVFPYTLLFQPIGEASETTLLVILNVANLIVVIMLMFMAYPLSFFGTEKPDRVIKAHLLEFMLRGPLTGAAVLATILFVPRVGNVLGLDGEALMPFASVAVVLFLQWVLTLILPVLLRWLVYTRDQQQTQWIQSLGDRMLTRADASQLLESILAAICDNLRVPTAFVVSAENGSKVRLIQAVGSLAPSDDMLADVDLKDLLRPNGGGDRLFTWHSYWLVPLYRPTGIDNHNVLLGVLGIWARAPEPDLFPDELESLQTLSRQAAQVIDDLKRQSDVFSILEGLASQMDMMQQLRGVSRYGHVSPFVSSPVITDPDFPEMVKEALRDYWGGPKLTESQLLRLNVVRHEMNEAKDNNPARALRGVLTHAIENLKPDSERSMTTAEWVLYNILEMRFLQGRKVRDVALKLAMSESDLYRKQRIAIEEVAHQIEEMERMTLQEEEHHTSPVEKERSTV